jgi:hypothetical protein
MARRSKTSKAPTEHRWRIVRIKNIPAALLGHVYAPDEQTALAKAIEEFEVQPAWRNRLLAIREG